MAGTVKSSRISLGVVVHPPTVAAISRVSIGVVANYNPQARIVRVSLGVVVEDVSSVGRRRAMSFVP